MICSPHSLSMKNFACPVERFWFQTRVVFHCGQHDSMLSSYNEAQHWSVFVERSHDCEHVQAIRVYLGRETINAVFA